MRAKDTINLQSVTPHVNRLMLKRPLEPQSCYELMTARGAMCSLPWLVEGVHSSRANHGEPSLQLTDIRHEKVGQAFQAHLFSQRLVRLARMDEIDLTRPDAFYISTIFTKPRRDASRDEDVTTWYVCAEGQIGTDSSTDHIDLALESFGIVPVQLRPRILLGEFAVCAGENSNSVANNVKDQLEASLPRSVMVEPLLRSSVPR